MSTEIRIDLWDGDNEGEYLKIKEDDCIVGLVKISYVYEDNKEDSFPAMNREQWEHFKKHADHIFNSLED